MPMVVLLHRVSDYEVFRRHYDEADTLRQLAGVTGQSHHRMSGDPNNVLVIHHFESMEAAENFFNHPLFFEVQKEIGVQDPIRIEYFE